MKMNFKQILFILMIQIATGLIVFTLTRNYYSNQPPVVSKITAPPVIGSVGPSTQDLINSLEKHPEINLSSDPQVIDQQANEAFQRGDYAKAAILYQRVIELVPDMGEPHNNLGLTMQYLGRSAEALEILKRGTELQPQYQRTWLTLGFVQSRVGNIQEAKAALKRAIELGPETGPGQSASEMLSKLP